MSATKEKKHGGFLRRLFGSSKSDDDGNAKRSSTDDDKQVPAYHHSTNLYEKTQAEKRLNSPPSSPLPNKNDKDVTADALVIATEKIAKRNSNERAGESTSEDCFDADTEVETTNKPKSPSSPSDTDKKLTAPTSEAKGTAIITKANAPSADQKTKHHHHHPQHKMSKTKEAKATANGKTNSSSGHKHGGSRKTSRKRRARDTSSLSIDVTKPLEYPCTPEVILAYHKHKPFLTRMEENLIIELNEYECLVDSREILQTIAKQTKLFEVEPQDFWEEFFAFVEDMPSYDEIINFDVWQEFRDEKYPY